MRKNAVGLCLCLFTFNVWYIHQIGTKNIVVSFKSTFCFVLQNGALFENCIDMFEFKMVSNCTGATISSYKMIWAQIKTGLQFPHYSSHSRFAADLSTFSLHLYVGYNRTAMKTLLTSFTSFQSARGRTQWFYRKNSPKSLTDLKSNELTVSTTKWLFHPMENCCVLVRALSIFIFLEENKQVMKNQKQHDKGRLLDLLHAKKNPDVKPLKHFFIIIFCWNPRFWYSELQVVDTNSKRISPGSKVYKYIDITM